MKRGIKEVMVNMGEKGTAISFPKRNDINWDKLN